MKTLRQIRTGHGRRAVSDGTASALATLALAVVISALSGITSAQADPRIPGTDAAAVALGQGDDPAGPGNNTAATKIYLPLVRQEYGWTGIAEWTPWALPGEMVTGLEVGPAPGELWAITYDGLYRSTDYGRQWGKADAGLPEVPRLLAVEDSTAPDSAVYATAWFGQIYVSYDAGATWAMDADLAQHLNFLSFVNGTLYAATWVEPWQVWRRLPAGEWQQVGGDLAGMLKDLALYGSTLYAGTSTGLVRLMGGAWEPVTIDPYADLHQDQTGWIPPDLRPDRPPQMTAGSSSGEVHSLFVHEGRMFVSTGPRGLYQSTDGETWAACDVGLTDAYSVRIREMVASSSGHLFAGAATDGVFVSDSQGDRWQALDAGLPHSTTAYGVLLDGVAATALTLVRDEGDEQTLGAVFNDQGVWFLTLTGDTLLPDPPPQTPPKAVLVVGPVDPPDHTATQSYIAWADRLAAIMAQNGMEVVKVYWPESTWEKVREALDGASIVVYKGHGFGLGDLPADPTEMYGGLNGFCLVHPEEPAGARLGTQDMLVTTNRLAENAIGFFFCCYCAGGSGGDPAPVSGALARRRIEAYSSTMIRLGGGGYFSGVNEEAVLEDMFAHPDKTLGEIYRDAGGDPEHVSSHVLWPLVSVWFDGDTQRGWSRAFVGDPDLTARDVLGW